MRKSLLVAIALLIAGFGFLTAALAAPEVREQLFAAPVRYANRVTFGGIPTAKQSYDCLTADGGGRTWDAGCQTRGVLVVPQFDDGVRIGDGGAALTRVVCTTVDYDFPDGGGTHTLVSSGCVLTPELSLAGAHVGDPCFLAPQPDGGFVADHSVQSCAVVKDNKVRLKNCNLDANGNPADAGYRACVLSLQ